MVIINPKKVKNYVNLIVVAGVIVIGIAVSAVIFWVLKIRKRNKDLTAVSFQQLHVD